MIITDINVILVSIVLLSLTDMYKIVQKVVKKGYIAENTQLTGEKQNRIARK